MQGAEVQSELCRSLIQIIFRTMSLTFGLCMIQSIQVILINSYNQPSPMKVTDHSYICLVLEDIPLVNGVTSNCTIYIIFYEL